MRPILAMALAALLLSPACTPKDAAAPAKKASLAVVGVARPVREQRGQSREYTGTLESTNQVAIVSQLAGQLETVTVEVGDPVYSGQLLATVDDSQLEAQVSQAQANAEAARAGVQTALANQAAARDQVLAAQQAVGQARSQVIQSEAGVSKAQTQVRLTRKNLGRIKVMAAKDLIAQQVVDESAAQEETARADERSARAQLDASKGQLEQLALRVNTAMDQEKAARAQVDSARAQASSQASALRAAEVRRSYTRLLSPMRGVVIARPMDPGAYVAPGSATPVLVVASLSGLRVSFQLSEGDMGLARLGQRLQVRFDALPQLKLEGEVQRLAGGLDPSTRTVRVEVRLFKVDKSLRPGMLARLSLEGVKRDSLTVPIQAVLSQGKEQFVWVVDSDEKAHKRKITVDLLEGDRAYVTSGLEGSDQVVVRGVDQVQEDKKVKASQVGPEQGGAPRGGGAAPPLGQ